MVLAEPLFIVKIFVASEGLFDELLSRIHCAQVTLSLCELHIKTELHKLLEALVAIFR